jgi:Mannosyl-glycoprotein endo-beta-N-acetylglucosaminidase
MDTAANTTPDQAQQIIYDTLRNSYGLGDTIAKIITAQSGHETAGWTSNVYTTLNNCFGFGYTGGGNYYGYNSIEDSVSDVVNWLSNNVPNFQNITDPDTYATALKSAGYYTDAESNYAAGIENWINNNLQLTAGISVAALVGIALVVYLLVKK